MDADDEEEEDVEDEEGIVDAPTMDAMTVASASTAAATASSFSLPSTHVSALGTLGGMDDDAEEDRADEEGGAVSVGGVGVREVDGPLS